MRKFNHSICLLFGIFIFSSCNQKEISKKNELFSVEVYSPTFPVLIGKDNNPVFRINIQPKEGKILTVEEIILDLSGTTRLTDINQVSVYYTGINESFSDEIQYGMTSSVTQEIKISGSQIVNNASNYFWVSLSLNNNADLDHVIQARIVSVRANNKTVNIIQVKNKSPKRLGHALRKAKDDDVNTYRIPGLATSNKGTLLAVYDIRRTQSTDLQGDIDVGMSRSSDGGQSWEPMQVIMDMSEWGGLSQNENGIGDPCILVDRKTNTIWVGALWIHGNKNERAWLASKQGISPERTGQFLLVKSEDDGLSWSKPINITSQIKDPEWFLLLDGPGKGITMEDGTLVFPVQFKDKDEIPHSSIIFSKDRGKTWTIGKGAKSKTTEAQVVELSDHSLMLNMRDDRGGSRSVSITKDLGKTWEEHSTSRNTLREPVCMASLLKHERLEKNLLLFSNPNDELVRKNMTIKISFDEGLTWPKQYHTLIDEGAGRGYSCLTSINENVIGVLYEGSQADLVFQRIRLEELIGN